VNQLEDGRVSAFYLPKYTRMHIGAGVLKLQQMTKLDVFQIQRTH